MSASSLEIINYVVRPNKNVERKLIAEALQGLMPSFDISSYRYYRTGREYVYRFLAFSSRAED